MKLTRIIVIVFVGSLAFLTSFGTYKMIHSHINDDIPVLTIPMTGQGAPDVEYDFDGKAEAATQEAMVYKFAPAFSNYDIKKLADIFGLPAPELNRSQNIYLAKKDGKWFSFEPDTGHWSYQDEQKMNNTEPKSVVPDNKSTIEIAEKFLEVHDLLPDRFTTAQVVEQSSGDKITGDCRIIRKDVFFYPVIDSVQVLGVSRVIVSVGGKGEILAVNKYHKEFEAYEKRKIIQFAEAFEKVKSKKASINIAPAAKSAKIHNASIAYWEDAGAIKDQPYLQPVWLFQGDAVLENGEMKKFDAVVPALAR